MNLPTTKQRQSYPAPNGSRQRNHALGTGNGTVYSTSQTLPVRFSGHVAFAASKATDSEVRRFKCDSKRSIYGLSDINKPLNYFFSIDNSEVFTTHRTIVFRIESREKGRNETILCDHFQKHVFGQNITLGLHNLRTSENKCSIAV